jgi:hypothetical protein
MPDGPLSRKDWNFETGNTVAGYNGEAETYTDSTENVRIENGLLVIEALKENKNGRQYTSSRINTLSGSRQLGLAFCPRTLILPTLAPRANTLCF